LSPPTLAFREGVNVLFCQRSSAESDSGAACHNIFQSMPYSEGDGCEFGVDSTTNVVKRASGPMEDLDSEWQRKGATLSDKTAREEFGLTRDEVIRAIRAGKLQYREGCMHGNPWLRLLRREVETLVKKNHGEIYLKDRQAKKELALINRELRRLKAQIAQLEARKSKLIASPGR
jgi:hypothetical protein